MDNCSHFNCDCILHVLHALHASQKKQTSISNQVRELLKGWWLNYGETLLDAEKFCPRLLTFLFLYIGYTCRVQRCRDWVMNDLFNPRRACAARVTVVVLSVCLSVCPSVRLSARVLALQATKRPMSGTNGL